MSYRRTSAAFVLLTIVALMFPQSASAKKFRWKLKQGESFSVEMKQNMAQEVTVAGTTMKIPVDMNFWLSWTVESVDEQGVCELVQVIDRVVMNMEAPTGSMKFDSDIKDKEPSGPGAMIAQMLNPLVGQKIKQTMNGRGEMIKIDIPDEALAGLKSNPMGDRILSKDQLSEMLKAGAPVFPEADIEEGHSWNRSLDTDLPQIGTMKTESQYTYKGEEDVDGKKLDRFDVDLKIQFTSNGELQVKLTDQSSSGSIFFDSAAGRLVKSIVKQNMTMAITVQGQEMNQKMNQTMTVNMTQKQ